MFADILNFGKRRTLKEALGLFLLYAVILFVVFVVVRVVGMVLA